MSDPLLAELIEYSRDGEWGPETNSGGLVATRIVRGTDFESFRVGDLERLPVRYLPRKKVDQKALRPGDILIETAGGTATRPTGRSVLVREKHCASSDLPLCCASFARFVRIKPGMANPAFVQLWLDNAWLRRDLLAYNVQHTGVARFQWTTCSESLEVPLPDSESQLLVAKIFLAIDDLIENNRRRIKVLEEMAQAIYREWFVHFRFPGHEDATFVDSPLGPIPDGWEALPSSQVLSINPRLKIDKSVECPFITMRDVSESSMICHSSDMKVGGSGSKFQNGDTLFARITPCLENGKTGFVASLVDGAIGRGSTEFVVLRGALVGPCFTYLLARDEDFRQHAIKSMSGASGRQRVRNECFDAFPMAVPPADLAQRFESAVSSMFDLSYAADAEAQQLASIRDLLLPKLVTGEIDVSDLDLDALVEAAR